MRCVDSKHDGGVGVSPAQRILARSEFLVREMSRCSNDIVQRWRRGTSGACPWPAVLTVARLIGHRSSRQTGGFVFAVRGPFGFSHATARAEAKLLGHVP